MKYFSCLFTQLFTYKYMYMYLSFNSLSVQKFIFQILKFLNFLPTTKIQEKLQFQQKFLIIYIYLIILYQYCIVLLCSLCRNIYIQLISLYLIIYIYRLLLNCICIVGVFLGSIVYTSIVL